YRAFRRKLALHEMDFRTGPGTKFRRRNRLQYRASLPRMTHRIFAESSNRQMWIEFSVLFLLRPLRNILIDARLQLRERRNVAGQPDPNHSRIFSRWKAAQGFCGETYLRRSTRCIC